MLGPDGKVLKHTTKCGVAHCSYSNHCNLCSDMSPGSEHRDVSNHHASCPVWLALTTPPDVADKASPFVPGAELNNFLCTLSCGGEHVPVSYFTALVAAFKRLADFAGGQIQCRAFLVMEVGGTQVFRHQTLRWQLAMPTDARERNAMQRQRPGCTALFRPAALARNEFCKLSRARLTVPRTSTARSNVCAKITGKTPSGTSQLGLTMQTWRR